MIRVREIKYSIAAVMLVLLLAGGAGALSNEGNGSWQSSDAKYSMLNFITL